MDNFSDVLRSCSARRLQSPPSGRSVNLYATARRRRSRLTHSKERVASSDTDLTGGGLSVLLSVGLFVSLVLFQELALRLQPGIQIAAVNSTTLTVDLEGPLTDFLGSRHVGLAASLPRCVRL